MSKSPGDLKHMNLSSACLVTSVVSDCPTPWTTARQAPLSTGFSRQEYCSGLPFPSLVIKYELSEVKWLSRVRLFATPWTVAYQAPRSMEFSRQEYWSGLPLERKTMTTFIMIVNNDKCSVNSLGWSSMG